MSHVVVVGSGVAGTAAALAASQRGARVTLVRGGSGASLLTGGALDLEPWESAEARGSTDAPPLGSDAVRVLGALEGWQVGPSRATLAVTTGILRSSRGRDRALLDLASLGAGPVLVPRLAGWDAAHLARAWSAAGRGVSFEVVDASLFARHDERHFADAELARLHDDPSRLHWLGERLREALRQRGRAAAFVLPPWLGCERERATELSSLVGVPCGEAIAASGGPSGARFARARDRALTASGVTARDTFASRVVRDDASGAGWRVVLREGEPVASDAVVLATGGVLGGGLVYGRERAPLLSPGLEVSAAVGARGAPLGAPSSLFGEAPERHAWPFVAESILEHGGLLADPFGQVAHAAPGLYAAGELADGTPHTCLGALTSGATAGAYAATR